ncbi:MAG: hypothetical protein K9L64_06270, partial [Candidatus Izimaplasma sp.]|nr:hypothetical protein [Candidatus Izimaplasma bacterium]
LQITKKEGQNAYFPDLLFSTLATETLYPEIGIGNGSNVPGELLENPDYNPQAYFNGFDYDGAKEDGYQYFRIVGKVNNIPLDEYQPEFFETLPLGATISKGTWNGLSWDWTNEVGEDSLDKSLLNANFTSDDTQVFIRYRVTSEDGENVVYYDISVIDVVYNVTFIFDIYYCSDGTQATCVLAKDSIDFNDELVVINLQNISTDGTYIAGVTDPADYPSFTEVTEVDNKIIQFYYPASDGYRYRFGRNKSLYYTFNVDLPLDQYLNDLYTFDIEFVIGENSYFLNDASENVSGLQGKYFYIEQSIHMRTRTFNIYIYPIDNPTADMPYGLFEFIRSWGNNDE